MRRPLSLAAAAAALLIAACSTSPCQELGEKLCACTGLTQDSCKQQVEDQLGDLDPPQATLDRCQILLDSCNRNQPPGALFCEWIHTPAGAQSCGLAPEHVTTTAP